MRSNLWASGYDVDGTDQTSLGQFSGRVQQTYKHSVPRFFVPEHGTMFTLALVRFPPTATKEIQYLNAKGALTYTDIAGDPVLYGNLPPREISMKDVFRSGDSSKKFKIAEGQWYRYAPSYVSPAYHLLEGFPFIQEPPSGDLQERVLIRHHDYDQCFQSVQLLQWNSQVKFNVTVYRNLPTTRDSDLKFKIAEGQWYRYAPSYVSPAYHLLEGFPFIQEPPSGDLQERVLIRHHDYDQCFQSVQLLQWNSQVKFNVTVYRNLPTTRDSIMTS